MTSKSIFPGVAAVYVAIRLIQFGIVGYECYTRGGC